jgi:hypothetical protein
VYSDIRSLIREKKNPKAIAPSPFPKLKSFYSVGGNSWTNQPDGKKNINVSISGYLGLTNDKMKFQFQLMDARTDEDRPFYRRGSLEVVVYLVLIHSFIEGYGSARF